MPSNPGKPGCPNGSTMSVVLNTSFTTFAPPVMAGLTYFAPKRAWKPLYPPGSSGSGSGFACGAPLAFLHTLDASFEQCTAIPTKSVWARARAAVLAAASWDAFPSFHSSVPLPKIVVMSPVGSTATTSVPDVWACVSGFPRVMPVPSAPAVPTLTIGPTNSPSTWTVRPGRNAETLATLMFVAPAGDAAASVVLGVMIELLFSSTVFATETLPTSQPARVYETHGAGVVFGVPESPLTMLGRSSIPPVTGAVQYLKSDVNDALPVAGL